ENEDRKSRTQQSPSAFLGSLSRFEVESGDEPIQQQAYPKQLNSPENHTQSLGPAQPLVKTGALTSEAIRNLQNQALAVGKVERQQLLTDDPELTSRGRGLH